MAQNLIRLKQLNTTELSGFFASAATNTGAFASLFGAQIVYTTGNQSISGVKTFTEISCLKNATLSGDIINKNYADENLVKYIDNTLSNNTNLDLSFPTGLIGIKKINYTLRQPSGFGWGANYNNITWLTSAPPNPTFTNPVVFEYYPLGPNSTQSYGIYINAIADLEKNRSTIVYTTGDQTVSGIKNFISLPTVNNTGVLLSGQNVFVLQGGTTQSTTSIGDNYIALAGAHIGWSNTAASRRVAILENCVARKASIILHQDATGPAVSNITGSLINVTQGLTGIISQSMTATNNNNFINYSNSNLNVPFSAGDNAVILIHSQSAIVNLRGMANVYFYN